MSERFQYVKQDGEFLISDHGLGVSYQMPSEAGLIANLLNEYDKDLEQVATNADALRSRVASLEAALNEIRTTANIEFERSTPAGRMSAIYKIREICRAIPPQPDTQQDGAR